MKAISATKIQDVVMNTLIEHFNSTWSQTMARPRQTRGQICTIWTPKNAI